jgi:hypothetical protein
MLVALIPLAFLARYPTRMQIGWWTVGLTVVWNIQTHLIGFGITDARWLEMVHIPLAFFILGTGGYLTWIAFVALKAHRT